MFTLTAVAIWQWTNRMHPCLKDSLCRRPKDPAKQSPGCRVYYFMQIAVMYIGETDNPVRECGIQNFARECSVVTKQLDRHRPLNLLQQTIVLEIGG